MKITITLLLFLLPISCASSAFSPSKEVLEIAKGFILEYLDSEISAK